MPGSMTLPCPLTYLIIVSLKIEANRDVFLDVVVNDLSDDIARQSLEQVKLQQLLVSLVKGGNDGAALAMVIVLQNNHFTLIWISLNESSISKSGTCFYEFVFIQKSLKSAVSANVKNYSVEFRHLNKILMKNWLDNQISLFPII